MKRLYRLGVVVILLGSVLCLPLVLSDTIAGASGGDGTSCAFTSITDAAEYDVSCSAVTGSDSQYIFEIVSTSGTFGPGYYLLSVQVDATFDIGVPAVSLTDMDDWCFNGANWVSEDYVCYSNTGPYDSVADLVASQGLPPSLVANTVYLGDSYSHVYPAGFSTGPFLASSSSYNPTTALGSFAGSFGGLAGSIVLAVAYAFIGLAILFWGLRWAFGFVGTRLRM